MTGPRPPEDGHPLPARMHLRQHEVQAVAGVRNLAVTWTDDAKMTGLSGWTCGYSVSLDNGRTWSEPLFHKRPDFAVTANPSIAVGPDGVVFGVAMSADEDYGRGMLELSSSADSGASWTAWKTLLSRQDGIPDRPKLMAATSGDLHLVFSSVERTRRSVKVLKSTIQHMRSVDHGRSWSTPQTISVGMRRSRWFIDGFQGPAIAETPRNHLLVSWADYYGNGSSVSMSSTAGADFDPPVWLKLKRLPGRSLRTLLLGAAFGTPVTELAVDKTGRNFVISVHEAHTMGEVILAGSQDGGRTWSRRARLTSSGTNAALAFDAAGRLHVIWTELRDEWVDVVYAVSPDYGQTFTKPISLAGGGARIALPQTSEERAECEAALGSYQSLVVGDGTASAFWIDVRDGLSRPRLFQSTWQV
jgi:hypothetical protein